LNCSEPDPLKIAFLKVAGKLEQLALLRVFRAVAKALVAAVGLAAGVHLPYHGQPGSNLRPQIPRFSQTVALFVEAEPNGFADRWGTQFADWDKLG
jgi:hypothetical protein